MLEWVNVLSLLGLYADACLSRAATAAMGLAVIQTNPDAEADAACKA